jgi:DnaJ-class molecular chaperone
VVSFGKRWFEHVDYSALPEYLQIKIVKITKENRNIGNAQILDTPSPVGPYAVLFVLETAPWEVVTAAYKALALKCHPDQGGNAEDFMRVQKAYEELKSKHNS